ncbi:MAG TPA: Fic family protein [Candidatus Limnocylindria bacterium]|nr:Fic family protein [Candidatus Limnocylindria bacterium]
MAELERVGGLPSPTEAEAIWADIWFAESHNSTAIEGNTLALREVRMLLAEGVAAGSKEVTEYLEVRGYARAAHWVYEQATQPTESFGERRYVTLTELRHIHRLTVGDVWSYAPPSGLLPGEGPGDFRLHDIAPFSSGMRPPSHPLVASHLADWLLVANASIPLGVHLVEHLAQLHAAFERIHPFLDGNGRVGRLVLNLLLVRRGYAPAIIQKRDRTKYLRALARADARDDGPLAELLARAVKEGLDRFLLPNLAGPLRLLPLDALETPELRATALRRAALRGRLRAERRRGRWYSTKRWIDEYAASRQKGGRPRDDRIG